jgi:hypothetical protein
MKQMAYLQHIMMSCFQMGTQVGGVALVGYFLAAQTADRSVPGYYFTSLISGKTKVLPVNGAHARRNNQPFVGQLLQGVFPHVFDSGVDCRANHVIHLLLSVHLLYTPINLQMIKHYFNPRLFSYIRSWYLPGGCSDKFKTSTIGNSSSTT